MPLYWCGIHKQFDKVFPCPLCELEPTATAASIQPPTDFNDRVEPDTEKLQARIFELESVPARIHEQTKL